MQCLSQRDYLFVGFSGSHFCRDFSLINNVQRKRKEMRKAKERNGNKRIEKRKENKRIKCYKEEGRNPLWEQQ